MINALSFDLEYWYSAELVRKNVSYKIDDLYESVIPLINLLDKYKIKATFFVLGAVAEKHSDLVKMIYENGHEIASHGYSHIPLYELGKDRFEKEVRDSIEILKRITGE